MTIGRQDETQPESVAAPVYPSQAGVASLLLRYERAVAEERTAASSGAFHGHGLSGSGAAIGPNT
jgi:hypothetical protein